jgi:hypothetical protein
MYLFYNSRIHLITLYSGHVCVYYVSMLRCWHLVRILVRTDHPCLGVGCHTERLAIVQLGRCAESAHWPVESFSYFLNKFKTLQTSKIYTSLNPSQKNVKQFFCWIDLVLF